VVQVRLLVEEGEADIEETGAGVLSPVLLAAQAGRWELVRYLASRGAELSVVEPNTGATVGLMVATAGEWPLLKYLLEHTDADVDDKDTLVGSERENWWES
jgi:hypothetical protein